VIGVLRLRDQLRIGGLVVARLLETDRAREDPARADLAHHRHDRAGVDAAGQERSERYVRDEALAYRLAQSLAQLTFPVRARPGRGAVAGQRHLPVAHRHHLALAAPRAQVGAGLELLHALVDRLRIGHVAEGKVFLDRLRVDAALELRMQQQRLELRAEYDASVGQLGVVQRLHAEAVARDEQRLAATIPDCEREHAVEALQALDAPFLPRVHDHLGIRARAEGVAALEQLRLDLHEVEDLAVEGDHDRVIFVVERLLAALQIDDCQTPMTEADSRLEVKAVAVRTAMADRAVHGPQQPLVDGPLGPQVHDPGNAAHQAASLIWVCIRYSLS
jgi:hypothetical protein